MEETNTTSSRKIMMFVSMGVALSTIAIPYDYKCDDNNITPCRVAKYKHISYDSNFEKQGTYKSTLSDDEKVDIITNLSKHLIEHTTDIDSEFVKIVNENFWDLI